MGNYEKLNFTSGQVLKAEHLNHMEEGIANAGGNEIFIAENGVSTFKQVDDAYDAGKIILGLENRNGVHTLYLLTANNANTYIFTNPQSAAIRTMVLTEQFGWLPTSSKSFEISSNKISTVTDDNKNSSDEYPNMNALTSYAVPIPSSISVGQTVKVSAVGENGVPTAWEAMDIPANVSAFQNDAGYITEEQVNALIDQKLAELTNAEEVSY